MDMLLIKNVTVHAEEETIPNGYVLIDGERIAETGREWKKDVSGLRVLEFTGKEQLIPGMIDLHIHGAGGADVMDTGKEALDTMTSLLPEEGTTSFLATTMTGSKENIEKAIQNAGEYMRVHGKPGSAEVLGIHLEGPFLSPKRAGAQHPGHIIEPDTELFKRWQELSRNAIRLVTLAPERPGGLELAAYLKRNGVTASIGHSDANHEEVLAGVEAGITHATHLYNGMSPLHHREPGVVGSVLLDDRITAEMIVDGVHISPPMVKLAYRNKGCEKVVLITDAMRAKCLSNGTYDLGGQDVDVKDGKATLKDGTLAGSILRMRDAASNMMAFAGCTIEDIIQMTAVNPARQIGAYSRKGSIRSGKDADLVVLDSDHNILLTICRGKISFQKEGDGHAAD
ncbi:N-acetylglucosamine-6-phosphate deacetylase [Metabacillus sp. GX 13764]|uniref:N-acetylglucosamine-6-phosphate deacetylase n=1 Tax=Metabacillus kandeliae TaxID=2900151 RepID=UPI001E38D11C|nr:N-acetylglucosamine-6-phosphate deacetylase [Metabacillus kandeliae]MCD7036368.1 N-acetylglucosamine-6-phosphate deacetylase [Metabacillus kandeliae]